MAERVGFEPTDKLPSRILSKDVLSATQPSLPSVKCGNIPIFAVYRNGLRLSIVYQFQVFSRRDAVLFKRLILNTKI